jgi:hypothetical protein
MEIGFLVGTAAFLLVVAVSIIRRVVTGIRD